MFSVKVTKCYGGEIKKKGTERVKRDRERKRERCSNFIPQLETMMIECKYKLSVNALVKSWATMIERR